MLLAQKGRKAQHPFKEGTQTKWRIDRPSSQSHRLSDRQRPRSTEIALGELHPVTKKATVSGGVKLEFVSQQNPAEKLQEPMNRLLRNEIESLMCHLGTRKSFGTFDKPRLFQQ
jgi:hypothetical protein